MNDEHTPSRGDMMHPFAGPVDEAPLSRAPLVKVVCQVRFPKPLSFGPATVEAARNLLAPKYPVAREQTGTVLVLGPDGVSQQQDAEKTWTMSDVHNNWRIVLAQNFVSIETSLYNSRSDFMERVGDLLEATQKSYAPPVYDRLGVRYVNRIEEVEDLDRLELMVKPVALAGLGVPHEDVKVRHSLCDTLFVDGSANIQARWGWLPAGAVIDADLSAPTVEHWMLDIDVFSSGGTQFDSGELTSQAREFAEKSYRLFRWLVTDEFIENFGG
ncbi:TIGR04255 family protein [Amycolatopsis sp. NPDC058278]|uniref:TIGR04255 family protein n=1 Tax=Amycolatopsis sp. NPDC058278 TaxID=3346417 RepID=UPI0036DF914C